MILYSFYFSGYNIVLWYHQENLVIESNNVHIIGGILNLQSCVRACVNQVFSDVLVSISKSG